MLVQPPGRGPHLPGGPRWHDGRLWFSDFYSHRVLAVDLDGCVETIAAVARQASGLGASGLGWTPEGTLLIVSMLNRRSTPPAP